MYHTRFPSWKVKILFLIIFWIKKNLVVPNFRAILDISDSGRIFSPPLLVLGLDLRT